MATSTDYLKSLQSGEAKLLKPRAAGRAMLYNKLGAELGLSQAERSQFIDKSTQQQQAAVNAATQEATQSALAAGPQYAGQHAKALKDISDAGRQMQASATRDAEEVSQAKAINDFAQQNAMLNAERDRITQQTQFYFEQLFGATYGLATGAASNSALAGGQQVGAAPVIPSPVFPGRN